MSWLGRFVARRLCAAPNGGRAPRVDGAQLPSLYDSLHGFAGVDGTPHLAYGIISPKPTRVVADSQTSDEGELADAQADHADWERCNLTWGEGRCMQVAWPQPQDRTSNASGPAQVVPKATILCLCGSGQSITTSGELLPLQATLANEGYRLIGIDLRGHGLSGGRSRGWGVADGQDLSRLIEHLQRRGHISGSIGVLGVSYGAGVAIHAAAATPRVRAVMAIAPWGGLRHWLREKLEIAAMDKHPYVWRLLRRRFTDKLRAEIAEEVARRCGFRLEESDQAEAIQRTDAAVLLIHGARDENCSVEHSRRICSARPTATQMVVYEEDDHGSVMFRPWDDVRRRCLEFFDLHLGC